MIYLKRQHFETLDNQIRTIDLAFYDGKVHIFSSKEDLYFEDFILVNPHDVFSTTIKTLNHGNYFVKIWLDATAEYVYFHKEKNGIKVEEKKWRLSDYAK